MQEGKWLIKFTQLLLTHFIYPDGQFVSVFVYVCVCICAYLCVYVYIYVFMDIYIMGNAKFLFVRKKIVKDSLKLAQIQSYDWY